MTHDEFLRENYSGKRVALFGGSGQVGSYLLPLLVKHGAEVKVYDCRDTDAGKEYQPHVYDVIEYAGQVKRNIEWWQPHYVFNLTAKVSGVTYNERSHFDMGLQNVLLQALPLWICENLETRFVQFSTVCVLPTDAPIPTPELFVGELGLPERSNLGYGLAKQFGEWLCSFANYEKPNLSVICLRPSNLYGRERPDDPNGHVIPRFVWRLMTQEDPMAIRGLPSTERSFLHASDCAEASALIAGTSYAGTVNVPAHGSVRMDELLAIVGRHLEWMPTKIEWGYAEEQGYPKRISSCERFDELCSQYDLPIWVPRYTLERGIAEYVGWCRKFAKESA